MVSILLFAALLGGSQPNQDVPTPPVFRAEAYVVTLQAVSWYHGGKRVQGITTADVQASINKKPVAIEVSDDPAKPGLYLLSVNPPEELRDDKSHRIDVKVRYGGKWHDVPIKWTPVFEKAGR